MPGARCSVVQPWRSIDAMAFGKSNYMLQQQELQEPVVGLGLTRTNDPKAKLYELTVKFNMARPMREWIRATSKKEAIKFATNRYPTATSIAISDDNHGKTPTDWRLPDLSPADQG